MSQNEDEWILDYRAAYRKTKSGRCAPVRGGEGIVASPEMTVPFERVNVNDCIFRDLQDNDSYYQQKRGVCRTSYSGDAYLYSLDHRVQQVKHAKL